MPLFVTHLFWELWYADDTASEHVICEPSWTTIETMVSQLDGQSRPAVFLRCSDKRQVLPSLAVLGGPDEYAVSLERVPSQGRGSFERLMLIHPARFQRFGSHGWRDIGIGYHTYEIDLNYLTPDRALVLATIEYFATTGSWYPHAPFVVEAEDEEGEWRLYTD